MMQRNANENAACLRRISKRSDQPKIEITVNSDARLILHRIAILIYWNCPVLTIKLCNKLDINFTKNLWGKSIKPILDLSFAKYRNLINPTLDMTFTKCGDFINPTPDMAFTKHGYLINPTLDMKFTKC